mmetsp:Transcript_19119/g.22021  ORF Transcript_19119/g.22021 Transcript_19119/m.22021 type:complete len:123 (-) Transcript_19119:222-590(-)
MRLIGPDGKEMSRDDVRHFRLQLNEKIKIVERLKTQLRSESLILQRTEQILTPNFNPTFEPIIQPPPPPTFEPAHSPACKPSPSPTLNPAAVPTTKLSPGPTFKPSPLPTLPSSLSTFKPSI